MHSETAEGITKGVLSWSEEKIKDFVGKFRDKELAFINHKETVDVVKEQLKSGDWSLCKQYLKDKELKILVQMGLALRRLEKNPDALHNLRDKIVQKYYTKGLHIAQVVQNGILTEFIGSIASRVHSASEIVEKVERVLQNIDQYIVFIKKEDSVKKKIDEIKVKITANSPDTLILFSSGTAVPLCMKIKRGVEQQLQGYSVESKEEKQRLLIFIFKESKKLFADDE